MTAKVALSARRLTADVLVQVVGRILNLALGVVVTVVIVRALGARGFGEWSTLLATVQIISYLGDLGIEQLAVARAAADPKKEPQWLGALVAVRAALALPMTMAAIGATWLLSDSTEMRSSGTVLAATLLLTVAAVPAVAFQLRVRNDLAIAVMTVNSVLWGGLALTVAWSDAGLVALSAAFLASTGVTTLLQCGLGLRMARIAVRGVRRLVTELLRAGLPLALAGLLTTAYVRIDQLLVFKLAGSRDAGLYAAAYRLLDQAQFFPIALMTTLFPLLAAAHARGDDLQRLVQRTTELLALGSFPAFAFTLVAADPIVAVLFGHDYRAAAPALPILMGAYVSICFGYLAGHLVIILGLQLRFVAFASIALAVNVLLNLAFVPGYGFMAAAWVTLATEFLVMSLTMRMVLRRLGVRPPVGRLGRTAAAAAGMALLVLAAASVGAPLAVLLILAVISYPLLAIATRALVPAEVRAVLRREEPSAPPPETNDPEEERYAGPA
jgi:O-antigen/teichoic acid export membrane protein